MTTNKPFDADCDLSRYSRQMLLSQWGDEGQRRLLASSVTLIGCGALGSTSANMLARAGVGRLRIIDRDVVEPHNLHRQVLYEESDIKQPKALAAAKRLRGINSSIEIEGIVTDVNHENIESLCDGADVLLDGTDNFDTRALLNDVSIKTGRPWVYGACIQSTGRVMTVLPGETPCLRCLYETAPPAELYQTVDAAGVIGPVVCMVASLQVVEVVKLLMGRRDEVVRGLTTFDVWTRQMRTIGVQSLFDQGDCPCCKLQQFEYLCPSVR